MTAISGCGVGTGLDAAQNFKKAVDAGRVADLPPGHHFEITIYPSEIASSRDLAAVIGHVRPKDGSVPRDYLLLHLSNEEWVVLPLHELRRRLAAPATQAARMD